MKKREQILKQLVHGEAEKLKLHATKEELNSLRIKTLNPDNVEKCIYGQMTGSCNTPRAVELMKLCCKRVYKRGMVTDIVDSKLNGSPKNLERWEFWSPIEVFIIQDKNALGKTKNNKILINYLKGKTKTLEFE